jgi:cephalosporin hydroxylase
MKIIIDDVQKTLTIEIDGTKKTMPLYSKEAFELISHQWLKVGWNEKHIYTFTWLGRPIIQLPEDMIRIQEVIYRIKPDLIIETGVAHGGSLIYYASICNAIGKGQIIGVDIEIRPHNRTAIESHELYSYITLIEGNSTDDKIVNQVKALIKPDEIVLVILDSNHTKQHVLDELEAYSPFVTKDSYIVATDGSMKYLYDAPRGKREWSWDNPTDAALEFVAKNPEFVVEQPEWMFNESELTEVITHWPCAYLKRVE